MKVNFEDRDWEFDLDEITLAEARSIKRQTGLSLMKLQEALTEADPDALVALYWLMKHQNGITVDVNKVDLKIVKFASALADASEKERADELGVSVEELRKLVQEATKRNVTVEAILAERGEGTNPTDTPADEPATTSE